MAGSNIQQKVASLGELSRPELVDLWVKQYGCTPPSGVRLPLLIRSAAWHLQERHLGGFSTNAKRLLKVAVKRVEAALDRVGDAEVITVPGVSTDPASANKKAKACENDGARARLLPPTGARLIREWNGRRYVVEVVDGGFVMHGKSYRSLTAIAFQITGTKWSGPRFFGL